MGVNLPKKQKMFDQERLLHFSLRKFNSGVASVAVASSLMFLGTSRVEASEPTTGDSSPGVAEEYTLENEGAVEVASETTETTATPAVETTEATTSTTTTPSYAVATDPSRYGVRSAATSASSTEADKPAVTETQVVDKSGLYEANKYATYLYGKDNVPDDLKARLFAVLNRGLAVYGDANATQEQVEEATQAINELTAEIEVGYPEYLTTFEAKMEQGNAVVSGQGVAGGTVIIKKADGTTHQVTVHADGRFQQSIPGAATGDTLTAAFYDMRNRLVREEQANVQGNRRRARAAEQVDFDAITNFATPDVASATGAYVGLTDEWKDVNNATGSIRQNFTLYGENHQVEHHIAPISGNGKGYKTPEFSTRYIIQGFPDDAWGAPYKDKLHYVYDVGSGRYNEFYADVAAPGEPPMSPIGRYARIDPVQGLVLKTVYKKGDITLTNYTVTSASGEVLHKLVWENTSANEVRLNNISYKLDTELADVDSVPVYTLGGNSGIVYIENKKPDDTEAFRVRFRVLKTTDQRTNLEAGHYTNPTTAIKQEDEEVDKQIYTGDSGVRVRMRNVVLQAGEKYEMITGDQIRLRKPIVMNLREITVLKGQPDGWNPQKHFISASLTTPDGQTLNVPYSDLVPIYRNLDFDTPGEYEIIFDADGTKAITKLIVLDTLTATSTTHTLNEKKELPAAAAADAVTGSVANYTGATFASGTKPGGVFTPGAVNGLTVDAATGKLVGTPTVTDWGPTEETREVTLNVVATHTVTVTDPANPGQTTTKTITAESTVTVTIRRDTDNDGLPDLTDTDDDADGIPDNQDTTPAGFNGPKDFDALTATPTGKTLLEKKAITTVETVITTNKTNPTYEIAPDGMPAGVTGLTLARDGEKNIRLTGRPVINNWANDAEESRDVEIVVNVGHAADQANAAPGTYQPLRIVIPVTIERDTDGDGEKDITDTDDDNDGILDNEDTAPKVVDPLAGTGAAHTLTEKQAVAPGTLAATSNKKNTTFVIESITKDGVATPVTGLTLTANGDANRVELTGTPRVADWADTENSREVVAKIKLTHAADVAPVYADLTLTILRDTDGDGTPDDTGVDATSDSDDDGDGIPDDTDPQPKVKTRLTGTPTPQTLEEKKPVPGTPVVITANKPDTTFEMGTLPEGLSGVTIDATDGTLSGTPVLANWGLTEESRTVNVPVKLKFTTTDTNVTPNPEEVTTNVPLTILRDTDGDGTLDRDDDDDDNDGIPDVTDPTPKQATPLSGTPTPTTVTEKAPVDTKVIESNKVDTTFTILSITKDGVATPVTGLELTPDADNKSANLTGAAVVGDWAATEESRQVTVKVQLTNPADAAPIERDVLVTINRDTDGDGTPDATDQDDDGDGIPDVRDDRPKQLDPLAVTTHEKTLTDKKPVPGNTDVVDTNKPTNVTITMGALPAGLTGLAIDPATGILSGTPDIADWGASEEERTVSIPVTVVHNGPTPGAGTETVDEAVILKIQRDTDNDGIVDVNDDDDDNDGIPDVTDTTPKQATPLAGDPTAHTFPEKKAIDPDTTFVTSNKTATRFAIESITANGVPTPVTGLSLVPNADRTAVAVVGTPEISNWTNDPATGTFEEERDVVVKVKLTHEKDAAPVFVDVPVKILRDTDGDGLVDSVDPDDDNDGFLDADDVYEAGNPDKQGPKVRDGLKAITQPQVLVDKRAVVTEPQVILANKPAENVTYEMGALPAGLTGIMVMPSTGKLAGTPNVDNWGRTEENRVVTIPVTVKFDSPDPNVPDQQITEFVTLTILRDSDEDGIPDIDNYTDTEGNPQVGDTDDDNDGIIDAEDTRGNGPKVADNLSGRPTPARIQEKAEVPDNTNIVTANKRNTTFVIESITSRDGNFVDVVGLELAPSGDYEAKLTGRPIVQDWEAAEEARTVIVKVRLDNPSDAGAVFVDVPVTIYRDSDGDGINDIDDTDDDNDGIPDPLDQPPVTTGSKSPDPLQVTTFQQTLVDGKPVPDRVDAIDANKSINTTFTMGAYPNNFTGVTVDPITGVLSGTPVIDNWGADEEERYVFVPVRVARTDDNGVIVEEQNHAIQLLIQRDVDGDGVPDVTDTDDDNDGIPDDQDDNPKRWDALTGFTTSEVVVDNVPTSGTTKVVTASKPNDISYVTGTLPEHLTGLTVNPTTGNLEGTAHVDNWGENEEERDFTIPVTIVHSGVIPETLPLELRVTVQRDTDGDQEPDVNDTDDDGDGIPDTVDSDPKAFDALTGSANPAIAVDGKPVAPGQVTVTVNKPNDISYVLGTLPEHLTGLTVDPTTAVLGGTAVIDNWGATEEERDVLVPVTVVHLSSDQNVPREEIEILVPVKVQRDTDGDGEPDVTDTDDDNDSIPDDTDTNSKVYDELTAAPHAVTVSAGHEVPANTTITTANKPGATFTFGSLPAGVTNLGIDAAGNLTGTPNVDWAEGEETRTIEVEVTVKNTDPVQSEEVKVLVPITILRDQDGDGIPDGQDLDDDGDDIPDDIDEQPKTFNSLFGQTGPVVVIDSQDVPADTEKGVTSTNKPDVAFELGTLPAHLAGIAIDNNGFITGKPVVDNWGETEEVRDFDVPVVMKRTLSSGQDETYNSIIKVRVLRDTDGDGLPDVDKYTDSKGVEVTGDSDDDNDDILDTKDKRKKIFDELEAKGTPLKLPEGADVSGIAVITATKPGSTFEITKLPEGVTGLTIAPNGDNTAGFTGKPSIDNWGPTEESREVEVEVTVTRPLATGEIETEVVKVKLLIQRDTDRDGNPDITDPDDDGDSIPDIEDTESKFFDTLYAVGREVVLVDGKKAAIAEALAIANKRDTTFAFLGSLPINVSGISLTKDGLIVGTPKVSDWGPDEEQRTFTMEVIARHGQERMVVTVTITIKREKGLEAVTTADTVEALEGQPIPEGTKVINNIPEGSSVEIVSITPGVTGLDIDNNGNLVGTPVITNWGDNEESRLVEIQVRITKDGKETFVTVKVLVKRDTDRDGEADEVDADDDNDGYLDIADNRPKVADIDASASAAAKDDKENLPKTGEESGLSALAGLAMLVAGAGLATRKRKQED